MDNLQALIEKDIVFLKNHLNQFEREHREYIEDGSEAMYKLYINDKEEGLPSPFNPLRDSLSLLQKQLTNLQDSDTAFRALMACHAIDSQGTAIEARLALQGTESAQYLAQVWSGFWSRVKGVIQSIASNLWALISKYLNLKEWSIKGSVTTPAITQAFGLTGSAELQFTFEK